MAGAAFKKQSASKGSPRLAEWIIAGVVAAAAVLCFQHPDIWETSNHSWILLDSIFSGRFFDFYNIVEAHPLPLYYMNNANYSIALYLLFALWQLPVWIVCKIGGFAVNEYFLLFYSKVLPALAFALCAVLLIRLAKGAGLSDGDSRWCGLAFVLCPAAFFGCLVMGQYDTFCLALTLLALFHYQKGDLWKTVLILGAAAAFKFFPLLLLVPLVLLAEKRPGRILAMGASSLWLVALCTLLFLNRTGSANNFTLQMAARLLTEGLPGGMGPVPIFVLGYAVLVIACYFYHPAQGWQKTSLPIYVCMVVYGLLMVCIHWHPQWVILLCPFMVLCAFLQKDRLPWLALAAVFSAGFFLLTFFEFPHQMDANLFDYGLVTVFTGRVATQMTGRTTASELLEKIPFLLQLAPALFSVPVGLGMIFQLPLKNGSLGDRLAGNAAPVWHPCWTRILVWGGFAFGLGICWFAPALWAWVQCF